MTILEKNLQYLEKSDYIKLLNSVINSKVENSESWTGTILCKNNMGGLNISLNRNGFQYYIHSNYDPEKEAECWASGIPKGIDLLVVYGLGLGYHIEKLDTLIGKSTKIIVIEPDPVILRLFFENRIYEEVFHDNASLLTGENSTGYNAEFIFAEFKNCLLGKIEFVDYSIYNHLYKEQYEAIKNKFLEIVNVLSVNVVTAEYFKKQWLANFLMNVINMNLSYNGIKFKERLKNIPAIIVSAGPSLNKNIALLHEAKNKAVIFSAGSSFRILKKQGITPDFTVVIDGSPKIKDIYEGMDAKDTSLIFVSRAHNEVVQLPFERKLMFIDSEDKLSANFGKTMGIDFEIIPPDQTVAGACISLASLMGCYPIILVGQDFALTGLEFHAEGAAHMRNFKEELRNKSKDLIKTRDIYGQETYTIKSLLSSRASMEDKIRYWKNKGYRFINATEGGIGVAGCENMPLSEVMREHLVDPYDLAALFNKICSEPDSRIELDKNKLDDYFFRLKTEAVRLREKAIVVNNLCNIVKKELLRDKLREEQYAVAASKLNLLQQEIEEDGYYNEIVVASVMQSIAIHQLVMDDNLKKAASFSEKNLSRIEFMSKQMMEICEVCTFIETFVKNVYEPVYISN